MKEPTCPSCEVELYMTGEEEDGDFVFCPYCGNELRLKRENGGWEARDEY